MLLPLLQCERRCCIRLKDVACKVPSACEVKELGRNVSFLLIPKYVLVEIMKKTPLDERWCWMKDGAFPVSFKT